MSPYMSTHVSVHVDKQPRGMFWRRSTHVYAHVCRQFTCLYTCVCICLRMTTHACALCTYLTCVYAHVCTHVYTHVYTQSGRFSFIALLMSMHMSVWVCIDNRHVYTQPEGLFLASLDLNFNDPKKLARQVQELVSGLYKYCPTHTALHILPYMYCPTYTALYTAYAVPYMQCAINRVLCMVPCA